MLKAKLQIVKQVGRRHPSLPGKPDAKRPPRGRWRHFTSEDGKKLNVLSCWNNGYINLFPQSLRKEIMIDIKAWPEIMKTD
jgi:hypothetical protein